MTNITRRSMLAAISLGGLAGLVPAAQAKPQAAAATELKGAEYFDVVVAGGGAAGCMAARTASRAGKKVLLVQAVPVLGGSSAISSGWIRACGTEWHKARGIKDTTEAYKADIIAYGRGSRNEKKADMISKTAGRFVNDLFSIGVEFTDEEDRVNGGETLRVVKAKGAGAAIMRKLAQSVSEDANITVRTQTSLTDVILDDEKKETLSQIKFRIEAVRNAEDKKYVRMNAPKARLNDIINVLPGLKSPTVIPLADEDWCSVHTVLDEKRFWSIIGKLKEMGAQGILVTPIEKMIL